MLSRQQVIERFCRLLAIAQKQVGYIHPADCFCGRSGFWGAEGYSDNYLNDGKALEYCEQAVIEKIERDQSNSKGIVVDSGESLANLAKELAELGTDEYLRRMSERYGK